jgi:CDP-6-deoxy-D-xylo-4-hexulose-3-dehydrase
MVEVRNDNLKTFLNTINPNKYRTNFKLEGCSNYAFNLILNEPDVDFVKILMSKMKETGIEFRRGSAGGGNQIRQPYLKSIVPENHHLDFPNVEHVHFYGFYIGNFPDLKKEEVLDICKILNSI